MRPTHGCSCSRAQATLRGDHPRNRPFEPLPHESVRLVARQYLHHQAACAFAWTLTSAQPGVGSFLACAAYS